MIAVVTSCIYPETTVSGVKRNYITGSQRVEQSIHTLAKLNAAGISAIFLTDNSKQPDLSAVTAGINFPINLIQLKQYQFNNRGLNEVLMLLDVLDELPDGHPILKISGRYYPDDNFIAELQDGADFKVRGYNYHKKNGTISTRGYMVKNKQVFERFLLHCLSELFVFNKRIIGARSFRNVISGLIIPRLSPQQRTSLELAAARVLKMGDYAVQLVEPIGITGQIAGSPLTTLISE